MIRSLTCALQLLWTTDLEMITVARFIFRKLQCAHTHSMKLLVTNCDKTVLIHGGNLAKYVALFLPTELTKKQKQVT